MKGGDEMTDRLKGCWVSFTHDIRDDDAEALLSAIRQLRGVVGAEGEVSSSADWMARQHVKHEIRDRLVELIKSLDRC
jgi:hypothetical protein